MSPQEAAAAVKERLARAKKPLLRISPLLAGEAIDRLVRLAAERKMAAAPLGMAALEPGWAELAAAGGGAGELPLFERCARVAGRPGPARLVLLAGRLDEANNVAFTEVLRWKRRSGGRLWAVGEQAPIYARHFDRAFPALERPARKP